MRIKSGIAMIACLGAFAAPLAAQQGRNFIDPAEIDREVVRFTGAAIGEAGGALRPADRRLRLSLCTSPLQLDWYGTPGRTVAVECPDPGGWRIFMALTPRSPGQKSGPVVKRGDRVIVLVRGAGFSIRQTGEATESGSVGEWVAVRTSRGGRLIDARIERAGLAVIEQP